MAIEPIQQYRDPSNSLMQVLQGGTQAITGILDRAIQIGRDMTDRRTKQEQDMLGMRLAETNLAQRRGEELQQNIEDAQRFAQNAYQFERKFGADRADTQFTQNRATAQDVLQQQNADRSYGLQERGLDIRENADQRQADEAAAELARIQAERDAASNVLTPGAPTTTPATQQGYAESPQAKYLKAGGNTVIAGMLPSGEATPQDVLTAPEDRASLVTRMGELDSLNPRVLTPEQRRKASVEKAQIEEKLRQQGGSTGSPFAAEDQQMQRDRFKASQEKTAATEKEKEIEQLIKGDTTSFVPQGVVMTKRAEDATKYGDAKKAPSSVEIEEAKAFDANRVESEVASAKRMSKSEYLLKGPQTPGSLAARLKVWEYANGVSTATPTGTGGSPGAVSRIPGI